MDYNKTDFQSQNFQLVGEDKFSVNFRSFALPTFDLDEHLRFDSLVGTEDLLGTQAQRNNWIDFPSGSSAIEFSSSASETCSISRHKNVWSDVTSSESVDLLLKSMGEDELITKKTVIIDTSSNNGSHDIDNQVDLYVKKKDAHKSSLMDILSCGQELMLGKCQEMVVLGPAEPQTDLLLQLRGSSQAAEVEKTRVDLFMGPSNGKLSSYGKIADGEDLTDKNATSLFDATEKSTMVGKVLCKAVSKESDVYDVFTRTDAPNTDEHDSFVVSSMSPESNQDVKLVMVTETGVGLFSDGQHKKNNTNMPGFLCDNPQKGKPLLIPGDEKRNNQLVPKSDALKVMNTICSGSVLPEKTDGLAVIPGQTKSLNGGCEEDDKISNKEECMSRLAMKQDAELKNASCYVSRTASLKTSKLTEGYRTIVGRLPNDSVEDDKLHKVGNQLIKNSNVSSDDGGKLDPCMFDIHNKQEPDGQLVGNESTDVKLLTELHATIPVNFENQLTRIEDCDRMSSNLRNLTCGELGSIAKGNPTEDLHVDRQEVKLDAEKDADLPEYSLSDDMTDAETKTSPSTSIVDVSHDKESSLPCTESSRINLDIISNVMEKAQDSPHDQHIAVEVAFDGSSVNKMVEEELDSAPVVPGLEKSTYLHLPLPQDASDVAMVVENDECLAQTLSNPDAICSNKKDVMISKVSLPSLQNIDLLSAKASDPVIVSYPLHMKETSPMKVPQKDSGEKLAPGKSKDSHLSECTDGFNLAIEQREEPSLHLAIPDLFEFEEDKMKRSEESRLSNCSRTVDEETLTEDDTRSNYVKDTPMNATREHHPNTGLQPLPLVQNIGSTSCQNLVPSSLVDEFGNRESLLPKGNCISHGSSGDGADDAFNSAEAFFVVRNEASVCVAEASDSDDRQEMHLPPSRDKKCFSKLPSNGQGDQCNLAIRDVSNREIVSARSEVADNLLHSQTIDSSQTSTVGTAEFNSSNLRSVDPSSSGSPKVINFKGCPQDDYKQQESLGASAAGCMILEYSEKDETTHKVESRNNFLKQPGISVEGRSFTFRGTTPGDLPEMAAGSEQNSLPTLQSNDIPSVPKENSNARPEEVKVLGISTKTPEGKSKSVSRPSNGKKAGSKGKSKQEASALKQSSESKAKYSSASHKSVGIVSKDVPLVEMREHSSIDFSTPFTDLQQVQLRAQIFVYGALLSSMLPDEAFMVSAFGGADGGRSLWEGVWHVSLARFQNQKSAIGNDETPPHSRPVPSISATKSASMIKSSSVLNSTAPLPSPLWSVSYGDERHHASVSRGTYLSFSQTPYPSSPCHTSQSIQHIGAYLPWSSQSPHRGSWVAASQGSSLDGITKYSTVPVTETVHATPMRDLCGPHTTSIPVFPPTVLMSAPDPTATTAESVLQMETIKGTTTTGSIKHTQSTPKARKRSKSAAAEEPSLPASQTLGNSFSAPAIVKSLPQTSTSMMLSLNSPVKVATGAPALSSTSLIISPTHYPVIGDSSNQRKVIISEEACSEIGQAKLQAEDAAALAASTVKHSQVIWSQLAVQKNSGSVSQIEEKLASAAVAVVAAASVAKAAAAAAKIASCAVLQSKIMVDEAMGAAKPGSTVLNPESGILDVGKRLAGLTPISILNGMDKIHGSGAVISAAREVARRRVESASASTKQAENLDAIVKAAELTAEAVAQAGIIITMGDPLPFTLSELVDENLQKGHHGASKQLSKQSSMYEQEHLSLCNVEMLGTSPKKIDEQFSKDIEMQKTANEGGLPSLNDFHVQFEGTAQGNILTAGDESENSTSYSSIQKGSMVEVLSDGDGLRGAWFSAQVLDIRDNEAYVRYNDVSTEEGQLKEWIVLEEGDKAPKIRLSCSKEPVNVEGTRKRYREQLGSYIWAVGDHVDAWMHDRWWEGTVIENNPRDETKQTVYFPARGDKQAVHAWNLRPSLIWKDGQWKEWSHPRAQLKPHERDTPKEKRQRLGCVEEAPHLEVDAAVADNLPKNDRIVFKKPGRSTSLVLSAKGRISSLGKDSREQGTFNALKAKRIGLQKEGSRVVFGVPRPGRRRKFMEVSKHYVTDKSKKICEGKDSIKFENYLMPQASCQIRNSSKINNKGKNAVERKPRGGIKIGNSQSLQTRSQAEKDNALTTSNEETSHVCHGNVTSGFRSKINSFDKNVIIFDSKLGSESSMQTAPTASLPKKKNAPSSETDLAVKAKSTLPRTAEEKGSGNPGKAVHEVMEPRRSKRRIQPTSRLLEGLQSSLIISKVPRSAEEKKSHKGGGPASSWGRSEFIKR